MQNMGQALRVVPFLWDSFIVLCFFLSFFFLMESLRIGTLNISGGRDRDRRAIVNELCRTKKMIETVLWMMR